MPKRSDASCPFDFLSPVSMIDGVGPKRAAALYESGIETVGDLLCYFPRKYIDRSVVVPLSSLESRLGETCTVIGTIERVRLERGRRSRLRALLSDGSGSVELLWFAGIPLYRNMVKPGVRMLATGRVGLYGHLQMVHPLVERLPDNPENSPAPAALACYPVSDAMREAGLGHRSIGRAVRRALEGVTRFPEVIPPAIEVKKTFPPLAMCLRMIHCPSDPRDEALEPYRARLRYEELYKLALTLRWSRRAFALPGRVMMPGDLPAHFKKALPFPLTPDQESAIETLYRDAASEKRMHRLLQGDVGCGKTLTAFFATFPALASGMQVAWMAPTEVLALQTWRLVDAWLRQLGFSAALLTGDLPAVEKKAVVAGLAKGTIPFVVGTHALIVPGVRFKRCGMMVIDEQHKFGAQQRLALQEKGAAADFLLMSATPIPQTLAKTLYGDLEIVTIRKGPAGRRPVTTRLVPESKRADMEQFIVRELETVVGQSGPRVYWVVPRIEQDDDEGTLCDAESTGRRLSKGPLGRFGVGCLHGRMSSDEKDAVMGRFAQGDLRILVCTTVVEVGIDVPEATVMVVENPERFGMAQLHQLRGRVGRGGGTSYCFLLGGLASDPLTGERLRFFCRTGDGFDIAAMDLQLRGPGEVAGHRQTGWEDLKMADIIRDAALFREIDEEIGEFLEK